MNVLKTAKIKITTKCNKDCDFCIFSMKRGGVNMPMEVFDKILQQLSQIDFKELHINGGEPTIHKDFEAISHKARSFMGTRSLKLGTNVIVPANNARMMDIVVRYYDTILIGCDDEHENYTHVEKALPIFQQNGLTVVVNSVLEGISKDRLLWLEEDCQKFGAIFVKNHVHHIDVGQPENSLKGLCHRYLNDHLMIQEDGSCYRCFNAMAGVDSELNVFDENFSDKLFAERTKHYHFCLKCHEYQDSGVMPSVPKLIPTQSVNA